MSHPKRYRIQVNESDVWAAEQFEHEQGEFVKAKDYLSLAGERDYLKSELEKRTILAESLYMDLGLFAKDKFGHCNRGTMIEWRKAVPNIDDAMMDFKTQEEERFR